MTHADLVKVAAAWLSKRCPVVITEIKTGTSETPDAIGWKSSRSIVVECKVSKADFYADKQKHFRQFDHQGMGMLRYFLVPSGLVAAHETPTKWGLLELTGSKVREVKTAETFSDLNRPAEIVLLLSALRRTCQTPPEGVSVSCYTIDTKCTATIGVEPEN